MAIENVTHARASAIDRYGREICTANGWGNRAAEVRPAEPIGALGVGAWEVARIEPARRFAGTDVAADLHAFGRQQVAALHAAQCQEFCKRMLRFATERSSSAAPSNFFE